MRGLLLFSAVALGSYIAVAAAIWLLQARLVFFPDQPGRDLSANPGAIGLAYEDVFMESAPGVRIHGWYVPGRSRATLLYFHGNAGNISHRLDLVRMFHELGLSVLIIDYQGYGQSEGKASEQGTYADARAAWDYLVAQRGVKPEEIIIFGRSLGGAVAAWLATEVVPAGVVLESTFSSIPDMAREHYPWLPSHLARIRYPTAHRIEEIRAPLLLMHSPGDRVIPFKHGQQLLERAGANATWVELQGGHNDTHIATGSAYPAALQEFFSSVLPSGVY